MVSVFVMQGTEGISCSMTESGGVHWQENVQHQNELISKGSYHLCQNRLT